MSRENLCTECVYDGKRCCFERMISDTGVIGDCGSYRRDDYRHAVVFEGEDSNSEYERLVK